MRACVKIGIKVSYLVAEGDSIDGTQVVIVFLHHLSTPSVVLQDLLVAHTRKELVWCAWIDAHNMRRLSSCELVQALSSFCIPQLHVAIVAGRYELCAAWVEIDVVDRLVVPRVRPQQFSLVIYVPYGDLGVCRCREEEMAAVRYEPHLRDRLGVVFIGVDELLRYEVLRLVVASKFETQICTC